MKPKTILKLAADIFMTLALFFLMGYHLWGEALHEWVGAGMFLLFIAHHFLNGYWHKTLFQGKYTPLRVFTLCIDLLVLASMLAQMYSGIVMSRYVFDFLPPIGGMSLARRLHILGAYWGVYSYEPACRPALEYGFRSGAKGGRDNQQIKNSQCPCFYCRIDDRRIWCAGFSSQRFFDLSAA